MSTVGDAVVRIGPPLAAVVVVLALVAVVVNYVGGTGHWRDAAVAAVRACVQLAALGAVLAVVIQQFWASAAFVVVMAGVAAWTSAGRLHVNARTPGGASDSTVRRMNRSLRCLIPVAAASVVVVAVVVAVGVLPATGLAVIPTAGILFGGAMNTTSLAGRRAHDELATRHGEVEAALSVGLSTRDARLEICRAAASSALVPGIDQTRSVGLVTIPGAFVGMILGGASTTTAAITQLFVLISLLAVSAVAVVLTTEMVARELL